MDGAVPECTKELEEGKYYIHCNYMSNTAYRTCMTLLLIF